MEIINNDGKIEFFARGNVASLKNGKIKTRWGLIPSKSVQKYMKLYGEQWFDEDFKREFLSQIKGKEFPIRLHFYFIRDSRRKFDYINVAQICQDLLVKAHCLPDDNADYIIPVFESYHVDKHNAGVKFFIE